MFFIIPAVHVGGPVKHAHLIHYEESSPNSKAFTP
jgi:hypothetical protein